MTSLRAAVDSDLCMSSGKCVADAPSAFAFDEDEIAHAVDEARGVDRDELLRVARGCPAGAIRVYDGSDEVSLF